MTAARDAWDGELDERASPAPLLQTWGWGEVQSRAGWTVERVRLAGGAMASVQLRGLGPVREAYVPRGPVPASPEALAALVDWARSAHWAGIGGGSGRAAVRPRLRRVRGAKRGPSRADGHRRGVVGGDQGGRERWLPRRRPVGRAAPGRPPRTPLARARLLQGRVRRRRGELCRRLGARAFGGRLAPDRPGGEGALPHSGPETKHLLPILPLD